MRNSCDDACPSIGEYGSCGLPDCLNILKMMNEERVWMCHSNKAIPCVVTDLESLRNNVDQVKTTETKIRPSPNSIHRAAWVNTEFLIVNAAEQCAARLSNKINEFNMLLKRSLPREMINLSELSESHTAWEFGQALLRSEKLRKL